MSNQTLNFTINLNGNAYTGVAQLDKALGNVVVNAKQTQSLFERIKTSSFNFDIITNAISKLTQGFQGLVGPSLDFEKTQANMKTLLNGNEEATDSLISKLREYGKNTVYDFGGLAEAQKTMMAFGLDAEYAFGKLKNIGDIALGDSEKMKSLALAFSQMSSTGKLMGQDLLQMINAGFNPLEVISQKTGRSIGELKDEMSKGAISAELVAQAFEWATEEGGRFYQGAETAAETTAGKIAKVKDTIDEWKISLFEATGGATAWIAELGNMVEPLTLLYPVVSGVFGAMKTGIGWVIGAWPKMIAGIKMGATQVVASMVAMKASIAAAGGFFPWLAGMAKVACKAISVAISSIPIIGWIAIAVTAIGGLMGWLYSKFEGVRNWLDGIGSIIVGPLINIITSFIKHWNSVKTAFTDGGILAGLKRIGFVLIDAMLKPVQALLELLAKIPGMGKLAGRGAQWIEDMRNRLDNNTYIEKKQQQEEYAEEPSSVLNPAEPQKMSTTALNSGNIGATAGVSAGKAQQITIAIDSVVGEMNFNGGLTENRETIERNLIEMMARILGMAETSI